MTIDWSKNATILQTRQENGAYYYNIHVSIHPMVIYTANTTHSVGTISDCTDHKASTLWAGLHKILPMISSETTRKIIIISDSPTSQYRNKFSISFKYAFK